MAIKCACGSTDFYDPDEYGRIICAECERTYYVDHPGESVSASARAACERAENMVPDCFDDQGDEPGRN